MSTEPDVRAANPYAAHPDLAAAEADVLWELAKLRQTLVDVVAQTRALADAPGLAGSEQFRAIDGKMALVLTLLKASVWGVIHQQPTPAQDSFDDALSEDAADTTVRR